MKEHISFYNFMKHGHSEVGLDVVMGVFLTNQMNFQRILRRTIKNELSLHFNSVNGTYEGRIL